MHTMILVAIIIGIIIMIGLFSFFDTYPDPIYFETFGPYLNPKNPVAYQDELDDNLATF